MCVFDEISTRESLPLAANAKLDWRGLPAPILRSVLARQEHFVLLNITHPHFQRENEPEGFVIEVDPTLAVCMLATPWTQKEVILG